MLREDLAVGIAYRCYSGLRCTFVVWDGDVTPAEWHAHADRMFADPVFPPGPNMLGDFRTAGGAPSITEDAMRQIGERWTAKATTLPQMRLALVPNGSWDKAHRIVHEEIVSESLRFILFNDVHGAALWLGVDPAEALTILDELRASLRGHTPG